MNACLKLATNFLGSLNAFPVPIVKIEEPTKFLVWVKGPNIVLDICVIPFGTKIRCLYKAFLVKLSKGIFSANFKASAKSTEVNFPFKGLVYASSPRGDLICNPFLSAIIFWFGIFLNACNLVGYTTAGFPSLIKAWLNSSTFE